MGVLQVRAAALTGREIGRGGVRAGTELEFTLPLIVDCGMESGVASGRLGCRGCRGQGNQG